MSEYPDWLEEDLGLSEPSEDERKELHRQLLTMEDDGGPPEDE